MTDTATTPLDVMPSATVSAEAEEVAWNALSREEQVSRYREILAQADCDAVTDASMNDILVAARQRVAARRGG